MSEPIVVLTDHPTDADHKAIRDALIAFNDSAAGVSRMQPLAVLIKDQATGETIGGLWGRTVYDWLYIEMFVIPAPFRRRGLGSQILAQAEATARARGCIGVWLESYEFQAPGFYLRHGYECWGAVQDHPIGSRRSFFKKRF